MLTDHRNRRPFVGILALQTGFRHVHHFHHRSRRNAKIDGKEQ